MPDLATALADLRSASAAVAGADFALGSHSDDALADFQRQLAESRRHLEVSEARVAAELAHRSRPELGYDGLAQRLGARSPEKLVQRLSGHSELTARRLVRVGVLVAERAAPDPAARARAPWLASAIDAVTQGAISLEAADAIRSGLGEPSVHVTTDALAGAARRLGGRTDLVDGVLLCRHHHLWIHNNGWRIDRRGAEYWLTPPVALRGREPVLLRSKSAPLRRLASTTARG